MGRTEDRERIQRWLLWVKVLESNLSTAFTNQMLWRDTLELISRAWPEGYLPVWPNHYATLYADGQIMAIRRIWRHQSGSISLSHLLDQMGHYSHLLSFECYKALVCADAEERPLLQYERLWGNGQGNLDVDKVAACTESLGAVLEPVLKRGDRRIAHLDARAEDGILTFQEVSKALEELGKAFNYWTPLLTGTEYVFEKAMQQWQVIFSRPLFEW